MSPGQTLATSHVRVAMGDVDAARIIYFAAPLRWQEALFTGWLQDLGQPLVGLIAAGSSFPTISLKADYLRPLLLDDSVRLELRTNHIGTTSFGLRCDFIRLPDEQLCIRMDSWHVWARMGGGARETVTTEPLPSWLRDALADASVHSSEGAA